MRRTWIFSLTTFCLGWGAQVLFLYWHFPLSASPHLLLLAVLALGGMGHTVLAQSLGFFWGLCLDVFGLSLFGSQALLLSLAGYLSGRLSRELNTEKVSTQVTVAMLATGLFWGGIWLIHLIFKVPSTPRFSSGGTILLEFILNAIAAPAVFFLVRFWFVLWGTHGEVP